MDEIFGFSQYDDHDFYHVRLGKGAVIIAVKKSENSASQNRRGDSDFGLARVFNTRDQEMVGDNPYIDPVQSIEEKDGFVKVSIQFDRRHKNNPSYHPISGVIERILPANQVTFEIVKENYSDWA